MPNGNKPVHELRLGRIKAAVFENDTQHGKRHNVVLQRIYRDEHDQWQTSTSFGRDDLPLVSRVADLVHLWLYQSANGSERASGQERGSNSEKTDSF